MGEGDEEALIGVVADGIGVWVLVGGRRGNRWDLGKECGCLVEPWETKVW